MFQKFWWIVRCFLGLGAVKDGSICWVTRALGIEFHDYGRRKGGNGHPDFFHDYTCPKCGHKFRI